MDEALKEKELWEQAKRGSLTSFERLYAIFYTPMRVYAEMIVHSAYDSEEIVNDVFLTVWRRKENIQISSSIRSYIATAVRNRCLDFLRTYTSQLPLDNYETLLLISPEEDNLDIEIINNLIAEAVESMPEKRKEVFVKSRFEEKSDKEIAKEMNISVKTVEAHKTFALKTLKEILSTLIMR